MELEVRLDRKSISIPIDQPFRLDLEGILDGIQRFLAGEGTALSGLDVRGLLPLMVKGIAGCEAGCPADAQRVVSRGYDKFALTYIEGGILTAHASMPGGRELHLKLFPDF
jgi:hypothetical protein